MLSFLSNRQMCYFGSPRLLASSCKREIVSWLICNGLLVLQIIAGSWLLAFGARPSNRSCDLSSAHCCSNEMFSILSVTQNMEMLRIRHDTVHNTCLSRKA
jgi:hypothetical protein